MANEFSTFNWYIKPLIFQALAMLVIYVCTVQAVQAGEFWTDDAAANSSMVAANVLTIADWAQTRESSDKGYEEVGFAKHFIGSNPTTKDVNRYFLTSMTIYNTVNYFLPTKWKKWFSGSVATYELYIVNGNYQLGVGMKF